MRHRDRLLRLGPLIAILALVLVAGRGQGMQCLITVNTSRSDQMHPDISGDKIVWEDVSDGAIHLYDLSTGIESRVASSSRQQHYPAISGSLVAWQEGNPWGPVRYRNLLTGTPADLTTNGTSPAVSGQRIAWVNGTLPGTLSLYTVGDPAPKTLVSNGDPTNEQPALSGDRTVWVNGTQSAIYSKNITTGDELPVALASDPFTVTHPAISGDRIVWQDFRDYIWEIYLNDTTSGEEKQLTSGSTDQQSPAIDGTRVVWVSTTSTTTSAIYIGLNMADLNSPRSVIASGGVNDAPRISSDRVVWQKYTGGYYDIYLSTIGSTEPCPVARFAADTTSGRTPLAVQFNDTSGDPNMTQWLWDFGDGAVSYDRNPVHVYSSDGTYNVSLTVSNDVGRDYTQETSYIRVGPIPIVSFSSNQTYGIAPLPVQFTDTSSGDPTGWSWNFGDGTTAQGNTPAHQNPIHTYTTPGTYTVSLEATNANGTGTRNMPGLIQALNGVNLFARTDFDGLSVLTVGSRQEITLDTTKIVSDTFEPGSPASFSFIPQPSSGWQRLTFSSSDGIGFSRDAGGIIRGNLSSCSLESRELIPATFTTSIGNNLPVSFSLDLSAFPPDTEINATIWEGVIPSDDAAFRHALVTTSRDFTSIIDTAYTLSFVTRNPGPVPGATLNLSVNAAWLRENGNENNIAVVRLGDDGIEETLNPSATFTDTTNNLDYFVIPSPHGLSRFALVSATGSSNLIQMGARVATQLIQSSGMGYSSGGSGKEVPSLPKSASTPAQPPVARPAATYYGEGKVDTTVAGITRDPVVIKSEDWGASLAIEAGTEAFDSARQPLTLVTAKAVPGGSTPPVPAGTGTRFTGMAYDVGPDGATFNPPATISFTIPGDQWNLETRYAIRTYSTQTGSWDDIPTSVDPAHRIVSGQVSHLCLFGLFAAPAATPATAAPVIRAPAANPGEQPKPLPRTPMGTFTGMLEWIYATAAAHITVSVTILLGGLASLYAFTRRAWLSRHRTWITLYLISLTGLLWASFVYTESGSLPDSVFIIMTVTGLNLIVHILRFDRIDLSSRARRGYVEIGRR